MGVFRVMCNNKMLGGISERSRVQELHNYAHVAHWSLLGNALNCEMNEIFKATLIPWTS